MPGQRRASQSMRHCMSIPDIAEHARDTDVEKHARDTVVQYRAWHSRRVGSEGRGPRVHEADFLRVEGSQACLRCQNRASHSIHAGRRVICPAHRTANDVARHALSEACIAQSKHAAGHGTSGPRSTSRVASPGLGTHLCSARGRL
eukprot:2713653-Rhodomonas_salina.3